MTVYISSSTSNDSAFAVDPALTIGPWSTAIGNIFLRGSQTVGFTVPGAYPYSVLDTDNIILVNSSAPRTITMLASPNTGSFLAIKDALGLAATNNITVDGNGKNISGSATYAMNVNSQLSYFLFNGTQWIVTSQPPGVITLAGNSGTATGTTITVNGGTTGLTTSASGSTLSLTGTLTVGNGGTGAASFTAHSLLLGQSTSAITALGAATDGQIPIGSTGADPVLATITAGSGVSVTNAAGSITIATAGGGLAWTTVSSNTQAMAANSGYVVSNGVTLVTFTLPATAAEGSTIKVVGNSAGGWTIAANTGQQMRIGSVASTVTTGTLSSSNQYDGLTLVCTVANTSWYATAVIGNITIT